MKYPILELMKKKGAPLTREEYLTWEFAGDPPASLEPEEEAALPPQFRQDAAGEEDMNCVTVKSLGPCTVFVKPVDSHLVVIATNVTVAWTEDWLRWHAPELRAKGAAIWVIEEPRSEARLAGLGKCATYSVKNAGVIVRTTASS